MVSLTFDKTITAPIIGKIARMKNMVLKPNISAIIPAIIVPITAPKVILELRYPIASLIYQVCHNN